jgi:hypothetical protein
LAASKGPATTSASTLTITMCLPAAIAFKQKRMPARGSPVASTITSMPGCSITASAFLRPAAACKGGTRARRRQVGDAHDMEPRRLAGLGQKHRAEFAGTHEPDGHGAACGRAGGEFGGEIHRAVPPAWIGFAAREARSRRACKASGEFV